MVAEDFLSLLVSQLIARLPMLLVELLGALIAVLSWRRAPRACLMLLLACLGLFGVSLVLALAWPLLIRMRMEAGWAAERYAFILSAFNLAGSLVNAALFLVVVFAVITGREPAAAPRRPLGRDDEERLPRRAEPPIDPTGIQNRL